MTYNMWDLGISEKAIFFLQKFQEIKIGRLNLPFQETWFSHHMKDGGSFHTYVTRHSDVTVRTQEVIMNETALLNAWLLGYEKNPTLDLLPLLL